MTSTLFEPPKRGRRARVLVVEQPGEGLRRAQQHLLLLLARQGDVARLAACIGRVLTDAGLRADLAGAARAQVVTTFTPEQQADRQAGLLDELVGGRGDRRLRTGSAIQQEFTA